MVRGGRGVRLRLRGRSSDLTVLYASLLAYGKHFHEQEESKQAW
jgi:hypothetical protein